MYYIEERGIGWAIVTAEGNLYAGPFRTRERAEDLAERIGLTILST